LNRIQLLASRGRSRRIQRRSGPPRGIVDDKCWSPNTVETRLARVFRRDIHPASDRRQAIPCLHAFGVSRCCRQNASKACADSCGFLRAENRLLDSITADLWFVQYHTCSFRRPINVAKRRIRRGPSFWLAL